MIKIIDFSQASSVVNENQINRFIVPLSLDTMSDCAIYKSMSAKFPELDAKFKEITNGKTYKPSDVIKVQLPSGQTIFFYIAKSVEKFQAYLFDIIKALEMIIKMIRTENGTNPTPAKVFITLPTSDDFKLSDAIIIPAILLVMITSRLDVFAASNGDHAQYIESISDNTVYIKRDSWKSDWMLTDNDIMLVKIIEMIIAKVPGFKINKRNLIKCYFIANKHGMFKGLEFYETEHGPFFKKFLPKCMGLINHALLINTHHYSKSEPPKFSAIFGTMYPHLCHIAYTLFATNHDKLEVIVDEVISDYMREIREKYAENKAGGSNNYQQSKPQQSSNQNTNLFL